MPSATASEIKFSPGGDKISARYETSPDLGAIRQQLTGAAGIELRAGGNNPLLASERDHRVEIQLKSRGDQLLDGLRAQLGADKVPDTALRVEWIGPKAGAQLRDAAIKSIAVACFFIMAYIAFRFDMRFAPGRHRGAGARRRHRRGRDGLRPQGDHPLHRRRACSPSSATPSPTPSSSTTASGRTWASTGTSASPPVINLSVSEMLGRTLITSGVTSLALVAFLVWGTGALKDFAFALLVGIVVGTYSSIYVAAPITEWADRRFFGGSADQKKALTRLRAAKKTQTVV